MSTLEVKAIQAPSGYDLDMPAGAILQVENYVLPTNNVTTTSQTYVDTGLADSITPTSTSSKILVTLSGGGQYVGNSASVSQYVTIYRDSTNLGDSNYGLSRFATAGGSWNIAPHSCSVLDSPSSTSSVRYQPYFKRTGSSATAYFSHTDRGKITLTLMEVAG